MGQTPHPVEEDWRNGRFGLYVHWPFCAAKCPYCDFNSHVARTIDHAAWREAYVADIRRWAKITPGRVLHSVFFGGGTPSLMEPETVAAVVAAARSAWLTGNDIEITLEANPTSVEIARFQDFAAAGVNRVSLGIQALHDAGLRRLGRMHTVDEALQAWDVANAVFDRTSLDLIYARQFQNLEEWRAELKRALALGARHLSLYQLTIEDGTVFGDRYRVGKLAGLPHEDLGADLFSVTQDLCGEAGLPAYEVSNHAAAGDESRHNLIYWRYGDYIGVGPGAHGRVTINGQRYATTSPANPTVWLLDQARSPFSNDRFTPIQSSDAASEFLMMSLRLLEGTDLRRHRALSGSDISPDAIDSLRSLGLLWQFDGRIGTTEAGRPLLNAVLRELL